MCEVLAVAAPAAIAFREVAPWAGEMERLGIAGFGWGAAWIDDGVVRRYRSERSFAEDPDRDDALRDVRSSRFLVHLRRPNRLSTLQLADTQPFVERELFAFCHNGFLQRHLDFRPRYEYRLEGRADSEVGFAYFAEQVTHGTAPAGALREVHERFGGNANLGYLGSNGELLIYGGHADNPPWRFAVDGCTVAATALHSDDQSLFDMLFTDATDRVRVGREVVRIEPAVSAEVRQAR